MNSAFFIISAVSLITYYAHVYRQATWKFGNRLAVGAATTTAEAGASEGATAEEPEPSEQKKQKTGKKG